MGLHKYDIYLTSQCTNYDRLWSLSNKLKSSGFRVKFGIESGYLDEWPLSHLTRQHIADSYIFVCVVASGTLECRTTTSKLLYATEMRIKCVLVLLEPLLDTHGIRSIRSRFATALAHACKYQFYDKHKPHIVLPIYDENCTFQVYMLGDRINNVLRDLRKYFLDLIPPIKTEKVIRKKRHKKKKRKRKPGRIGLRAIWEQKKPAKPIKNIIEKRNRKPAIKRNLIRFMKIDERDEKTERAEELKRLMSTKKREERLQGKMAERAETPRSPVPRGLVTYDSRHHNLTKSFKTLVSQTSVSTLSLEHSSVQVTRGILMNARNILAIDHNHKQLVCLDVATATITRCKELSRQLASNAQPYAIRHDNAHNGKFLVSFKDNSRLYHVDTKFAKIIPKTKKIDTIGIYNSYVLDPKTAIHLPRIWDMLVDDIVVPNELVNHRRQRVSYTHDVYILDASIRDILVFDSHKRLVTRLSSKIPASASTAYFGKHTLFWPRDMQIADERLYVVDTCMCTYDCVRNKLITTEGGNAIRIFSTRTHTLIKSIQHRSMLRPLGLLVDAKCNVFTTGNFLNNYHKILPDQHLFCFNKAGKILHVTSLRVSLRDRGICSVIFVSEEMLVFTALSAGFIICKFKKG